ncbi:MAG: ABC transporter ATP-binding protein [bacterium]|nr:ABC transporter ATP-binding protein [bacterium]
MKNNTKKTLKYFIFHAKQFKLQMVIMTAALILGTLAGMIWPILFREFFDILISSQDKSVIVNALIGTLLWIMLVEGIEWISWRFAQYTNHFFQPGVMANISNECFERLHLHSFRFFTNNFAGALVKKINRIVRGFERVADKIYWDITPMSLKLLIILVVLSYINPYLGLIMGIWTIIFIVVNLKFSVYKLKYDIPRSKQDSKVTAALADTITNSTNVKLFSALNYEVSKFKKVTHKWYKITKKAWDVSSHIEAGQAAFMILLEFAILYTAIKLWEKGSIETADFFLIQAYLFEMFHQLWNFGRNLRELYEALADSEEMTVILNTEVEVKDIPDAKVLRSVRGKVEFKRVNFGYGNDEPVIKNLSFKVKAGEKIALIGPSGGGKSTIVKLMLRLFEIDRGKILIDDQDTSKTTQDSLRKTIALVPQDPILFHRSLMDNIRYGRKNASNREVIAAAKMAHCHEFIKNFPKGYETFVGERGVKLSGGQRQRVAIARAILSNARILILDEATSSLDSESEKIIQSALNNLIKNKTAFIIAHRLSTIMGADRIFVLANGRIIEQGQHTDLVSKESSLYKRLWDLQVGGYL